MHYPGASHDHHLHRIRNSLVQNSHQRFGYAAVIRRALLIGALCLAHHHGWAAESPLLAIVSPTATSYPTEQAAAEAALLKALDYSTTIEEAGGIIKQGASYVYTMPVPGNEAHFAIRLRFSGKLVALYHTHPKDSYSYEFSPEDKRIAADLHVTSYIRITQTDTVLRLNTSGTISQISGPRGLCHHMECGAYYAAQQAAVLHAYGQQ